MTCVIHFLGDEADLTQLVRLCPIEPCKVFRRGEAYSQKPSARHHKTSGITLEVSDADFEFFERQKVDALAFLNLHGERLHAMHRVPGVEQATIDFGISLRDVFVQTNSFEPALLAQIASLGMCLDLSQYPPASGPETLA